MTPLEKANRYQEQNRIDKSEKPVFHVTPPIGWMNDPNGFSVYRDKIHLFYQYHPYSDVWGPMHWGHYVSEDFLKWEEYPVALAPDQNYDALGCFSGSAIETPDGHVLVYTGVQEVTDKDGTKKVVQQQCLAIGDGIHYDKVKNNPVISGAQLPEGFSREDFRDPKVWKEEDTYYLAAGSINGQQNGQVVLFESDDLKTWEYVSVLADNQGKYGIMWECPDFFALADKHVLIVSPTDMQADGVEFYNGKQSMAVIGEYNRNHHRLLDEQIVSLDYGTDFYAPQTLQMKDGRRIMIAWMQSWDMNIKPVSQKWNGMMTVPRQLELRDGVLCQGPVRELERYRVDPVIYTKEEISGECMLPGVQGRVIDLSMEILGGDYETFTIRFARNETYYTEFCYNKTAQTIEFDRTCSGCSAVLDSDRICSRSRKDMMCKRTMKIKNPKEILKFRMILDKYSVELFVNDGVQVFTSIFYTPLDAEDIVFECDGTAAINVEKYGICVE